MNELLITWILMVAPSPTDIHVENYATQINRTPTYMDCMELLTTYTDDRYYWCESINLPL